MSEHRKPVAAYQRAYWDDDGDEVRAEVIVCDDGSVGQHGWDGWNEQNPFPGNKRTAEKAEEATP